MSRQTLSDQARAAKEISMSFANKTSTVVAALAFAASTCGGPVFAQDALPGHGDMAGKLKERFTAADKNGDGKLTKEEAKAGMPFVYQHFDEIDKAHTGAITMADIAAFAREKRAAKQSGG
jgi:hypothetical protein